MEVYQTILDRDDLFAELCKSHGVKSLYLFGSATDHRFNPDKSDIDLLVEINEPDPLERGEKLLSFWTGLENFFGRKVDLLTPSSLKNPYLRKSVEATKVLIYDGEGLKIYI